MNNSLIRFNSANGSFLCTAEQLATISELATMRHGGIGTIYGYRPTTDYTVRPTMDIQVITMLSTERLYARKVAALNAISFADVADAIAREPKLSVLTLAEQLAHFDARKGMEVASLTKTLDGNRDDAHRAGHDRCYCVTSQGVKVHFVTAKGADGLMHPVLTDGLPVADSIMLAVLELSRRVTSPGVRKPAPNSGAPVLMGNAIKSLLNARSVGYSSRSLKADTFTSFKASGRCVTAQDVEGNAHAATIMEAAIAA